MEHVCCARERHVAGVPLTVWTDPPATRVFGTKVVGTFLYAPKPERRRPHWECGILIEKDRTSSEAER